MKFLLLFIPFCLFSQSNYQVKYNMITLFDGVKNYETKLTFSDSYSCFEYQLSVNDTTAIEEHDDSGNLNIKISEKRIQKVYSNFRNGILSEIKYLKTPTLVTDTLTCPIWKISNESKLINNHVCQKATTMVKGRNYEAWFTSDYPTKFGPWKLNGLPGLIIFAQDEKKEVIFEATEVVKINTPVEEPSVTLKTISLKEYRLEIEKNQKELEEILKSMGDRNSKIDVKFGRKINLELTD